MSRRKGVRPEQYAGVFQLFSEIPERYRLATYADQYKDEDTWMEYVEDVLKPEHKPVSEHLQKTIRLGGSSWLEHMDSMGRHHALATPEDVEAWCENLLDERKVRTAYENYYIRIYQFYNHLVSVKGHPHVYNPLLIAAVEYETARRVWMYRIENRPEVMDRE